MKLREKLIYYYSIKSKHSNYQMLPYVLKDLVSVDEIKIKSRFEEERLAYIIKNIKVKEKYILDIGGNIGFFTFELLRKGAKRVDYFEGNKSLCNFVRIASKILGINNLKIYNKYFNFESFVKKRYDIVLLMNVLHHIGDDFGNKNISKDAAKKYIIKNLNNLSYITKILILQFGFNWKGDIRKCLFKYGTKREMIRFVKNGVKRNWNIKNIGIAEIDNGKIIYKDISNRNVKRNNNLGEFLNRPIFILESKNFKKNL